MYSTLGAGRGEGGGVSKAEGHVGRVMHFNVVATGPVLFLTVGLN